MKKFKKAIICATACATALSVTALAACTDGTPDTGLSADVTVSEQLSAEQLGAQIAKLGNATACSFTLEGGLYATKMNNVALEKAISMAEILADCNLEDGNADIDLAVNALLFRDSEGTGDGGTTTAAEDEAGDETQFMNANVYLRGWNAFVPNFELDGYDHTDIASAISESGMEFSDVIDMYLQGAGQDSAMLLTLANTTDSITVDETAHTIKLDINGLVYGVYGYIKQIINNITSNTTVSGLLKCSAVKYYIEAYTAGMTAQELFDAVMQAIAGAGGSGTPFVLAADAAAGSPLAAIMPLQDENVYDYIVRLVSSKDVATLLGSEKLIGDYKISEMLGQEAAAALDALKTNVNALSSVITKESIVVPADGSEGSAFGGMTVSGLTLTYTYSESGLVSESFEGKIVTDVEMEAGTVVPCEMKIALSVTVSSEKITDFEDITDYVVNVYDEYGEKTDTTTVGAILTPAA